jgi:hypothetical protein
MPSHDEILDNVLINGKSIRTLKETATDKNGELMPNGITVQMGGYMGSSDKRLVIYLNGNLSDEFLFQKVETDRITIKQGFTSKLGDVVEQDTTYEYHEGNYWRKELDTSALEYTDLQVTSVTRLQYIGDTVTDENGVSRRAVTMFIYFDRPVSYERLLYVTRSKDNLIALRNNGSLSVSEEKIYGIADNRIGEYILDYIKYDGKTLRETLQAEDTLAMQTWGIDVHYTGDSFYTNAIQISFNATAKCLITMDETHTLEIMEGFVSPLLGKISTSYKFEYQPSSNSWKNVTAGAEEEYPDLPKSSYTEEVAQSKSTSTGCSALASSKYGEFAILTLIGAVLWCTRRREL